METGVDEETLSWKNVQQEKIGGERKDNNGVDENETKAQKDECEDECEDEHFNIEDTKGTDKHDENKIGDTIQFGADEKKGDTLKVKVTEPTSVPDRAGAFTSSVHAANAFPGNATEYYASVGSGVPPLTSKQSSSPGQNHPGGAYASAHVIAKLLRKRTGRNVKSTNPIATRNSIGSNLVIDPKYPQDCYSFIAVNGPVKKGYTKENFVFFLFGVLPFIFQILFLTLLIWSETNELTGTIGETDNPDSGTEGIMSAIASFIPANSSPIIRSTQVTAILAYVAFPDSSLQDIVKSIQSFPLPSKVQRGDEAGRMRLACVLRGIQGTLAMLVTWLLVMTSETVVDIILNFTAVNFISSLDDYAFSLALSGDFGEALQAESTRIANTNLPLCMQRKKSAKNKFNIVILSFVLVILFGLMMSVFITQDSNWLWVTRNMRVQFQGSTGLNEYSGCFEMNDNPGSTSFSRRSYTSIGDDVSIAYCRQYRQWILFPIDDTHDPCYAKDKNIELARSTKTDTYDIRTSFDEQWVSSTNTPLDLFFFESGEREDLFCNLTLGDGICDNNLNEMGFGYDDGDCCSTTCEGANCGTGPVVVFGKNSSSFTDFPDCDDPTMLPLTIRLDGIKSSRDRDIVPSEVIAALPFYDQPFSDLIDESQWRSVTPVNPYLLLDCGEKSVLFVYVDESMENANHTVSVADGANCTLKIQNKTANENLATDEPIWFVNYTLFHGDEDDFENNSQVEILSQQSSLEKIVYFKRIPECYFQDLEEYDYVDIKSIYTAIDWLAVLEDTFDEDTSECGERFALFNMAFSMEGADLTTKTLNQCRWPEIVCKNGRVTIIDWSYKDLTGNIPNELKLLEDLEVLKLNGNGILSISNEIGAMEDLKEIDLSSNDLLYIPSEIGSLTSLRKLSLDNNRLLSLPSEIGKLKDLEELIYGANVNVNEDDFDVFASSTVAPSSENSFIEISIPTQIWQLTSLLKLSLYDNALSSLPTEVGNLFRLQELDLHGNVDDSGDGLSSIPTEIGQLTNLQIVRLSDNDISLIPTEIGQLTRLRKIDLRDNNLSLIPTEIALLKHLRELFLHENDILSIPTEIGRLTSLQNLYLDQNKLKAIPTQIGNLKSLEVLSLDGDDILSIPSEVGKLGLLKRLCLARNKIQSIPIEIEQLTRLEVLDLDVNKLSSLPIEIGQLTNLQTLRLDDNQLIALPGTIRQLSNLRILRLTGNKLSAIPTIIGRLTSLQTLYLVNNEISYIPTEIGLLTNLQSLHVKDNKIASLPSEVGLLTNLQRFSYVRNNITFDQFPEEIITLCNNAFTNCLA